MSLIILNIINRINDYGFIILENTIIINLKKNKDIGLEILYFINNSGLFSFKILIKYKVYYNEEVTIYI